MFRIGNGVNHVAQPAWGKRFEAYIGIVSAPASFDYNLQQFLGLCAGRAGVMQQMPYYPEAEYGAEVADGERRLTSLRDSIRGLVAANAEIVAQAGGYWSLAYAPDLQTARRLEAELADEFGVEVILNWAAIVDALQSVGARRISVTTGYYRPAWSAATVSFLESAGFELVWTGDIIDQGIVADSAERQAIEDATGWDYPDDIVEQTCVDAARRAPDCDAVLQTGAGMRTSHVAAAVEAATGKPLVATDTSLHWAIMQRANLRARPGSGQLLDQLAAPAD